MLIDKPSIAAVLFDLDQTLTDRRASIAAISKLWLDKFGSVLPRCGADRICTCLLEADDRGYRSREDFVAELRRKLPWTKTPEAEALLEYWRREFPRCVVERTGATRVVKYAVSQGWKVGVVTNGSTHGQNVKIDVMGIRPLLSCVIVSETVGIKKPDPRNYRIAMEALGATPAATVFVGDNPQFDVIAPRKLGMSAIWLSGIFDWPDGEPPGLAIKSLEQLIGLL